MLSRSERIPRTDFPLLLESRHFYHSTHFTLRYAPQSAKAGRVAASVSKKISKSAVVRNGIRRRVYSALRPLTPLPKGLFLFIAKVGADKVRGEALEKELSVLLKSAERSYNF